MATVQVIHVGHLPSYDPQRQGKVDAVVVYSIDHGAPATVIVPDEDATPDKLGKYITAQQAKATALTDTPITI
jgi:hypothetical protein